MLRKLVALVTILTLLLLPSVPAFAAAGTTQDITVTATPALVAIELDIVVKNFGTVSANDTPSTTTSYFTIDNTSNCQTDQTIKAVTATWEGGATDWTHDDDGTPGADTVSLLANKGGTWGVGDVYVAYGASNVLANNQAATTDYSFGLKLVVGSSLSFYTEQTMVVRITAAVG